MAFEIFSGTPLYITFRDTVTGAQLLEAMDAILHLPDCSEHAILWDGRHIRELIIEVEEFKRLSRIAKHLAERGATQRCALVASREMDLLVAQYFKAALYGHEIEVFSSLPAALSWLGYTTLPDPTCRTLASASSEKRRDDSLTRLPTPATTRRLPS